MKKLILTLAALGIITGSGVAYSLVWTAEERAAIVPKKDTSTPATPQAKRTGSTPARSAPTKQAPKKEFNMDEFLSISDDFSYEQSHDVLGQWLIQNPEDASGWTSIEEDADAAQRRANDKSVYRKIHQHQTAQDWALYYSECFKEEKGCCTKVGEVNGKAECTDWDHKTLAERQQRMEEVCNEENNPSCNKVLLEEMKRVDSMEDFDRRSLMSARAREAAERVRVPVIGEGKMAGQDEWAAFSDHGNGWPRSEASVIDAIPPSDAVVQTTRTLADDGDISAVDKSAAQINDANRRRLLRLSQIDDQTLEEMGVDAQTREQAAKVRDMVGTGLSKGELKKIADDAANQELETRKQIQADILSDIRNRIQKEADAKRREELNEITNDLVEVQKSLANFDCDPDNKDDCYKVYDIGNKNGTSVTKGQTMSEYIDLEKN